MKKTYLAPTTEVVKMEQTQMLCASIESNVDIMYGGELPSGMEIR